VLSIINTLKLSTSNLHVRIRRCLGAGPKVFPHFRKLFDIFSNLFRAHKINSVLFHNLIRTDGYNDKDIIYSWSDVATPVTLSERLTIPQYTLVEWEVLSRNVEHITGIVKGCITCYSPDISPGFKMKATNSFICR